MVAHQSVIDISAYCIPWNDATVSEDMQRLYGYVINNYPECIAAGSAYRIGGVNYGSAAYVTEIRPEYTLSAAEYPQAYAEYNALLNEVVTGVPAGLSALEKSVFVHDLFVADYKYDLNEEISDAYRFLKLKKGVCQAYVLAYVAVMRKLGVECCAAVNYPGQHVWNVVRIGTNYYHIDLTQDDPTYRDPATGLVNAGITGRISRKYMLVSDAKITQGGSHDTWEIIGPTVSCTDTAYDNRAWRDVSSVLCLLNGRWYGIGVTGGSNHARLVSFGRDFAGTAQIHLTFTPYWTAGASAGSYWTGAYAGLFALGDSLYFNDASSLQSYGTRTGTASTVVTPSLSGGKQIFGLRYRGGGQIVCSLCTHPSAPESFASWTLTLGDTNGDGFVTAPDLVNVRRYLLSIGTVRFNYGFADLNEDGTVTVIDLIRMKKMIA